MSVVNAVPDRREDKEQFYIDYLVKLMMINKIIETIDSVIKKIWLEELRIDYANKFLLKEDSLKNAFYFHLRNRLGENFLMDNNLRIFTEYYVDGERIDLVIVEIDPLKAEEYHLSLCVKRVLAVVEMKHKGGSVNDSLFYKDVQKILSFIKNWENETKHYLAFIQEKYYKEEDVVNWLKDDEVFEAKGKITELFAYWNEDSDEVVWSIVDY